MAIRAGLHFGVVCVTEGERLRYDIRFQAGGKDERFDAFGRLLKSTRPTGAPCFRIAFRTVRARQPDLRLTSFPCSQRPGSGRICLRLLFNEPANCFPNFIAAQIAGDNFSVWAD